MSNPTITDLPPVPTREDAPANFVDKADAFLGALPQFQAEANVLAAAVEADAVQTAADRVQTGLDRASATASASSALNAPGTSGASTTSLTIGVGTKSFTTQVGKAWTVGQGIVVASTASPLNQMSGVMTAYNAGTGAMTVEVTAVGGSGTFAVWTVSLVAGAAMAVASQAEAETGTDNSKVMTPLRAAQAISVAIQKGAAVSAATTLTVGSAYSQVATMGARGVPITLPAANTLIAGPRFSISNTGAFDLPIKNAAGVTKAFVRPGKTATCIVVDNTTAAGVWAFEDSALYGVTAETSFVTTASYGGSGSAVVLQLDADRELVLIDTNQGVRAVAYNRTTQTWGALTAINAFNVGVFKALVISATQVLYVGATSTTGQLQAIVIGVSGTTVTPNTPVNVTGPNGAVAITLYDPVAIGSTYAFPGTQTTNGFMYALTVSGTVPAFGPVAAFGGGTVVAGNNGVASFVVGSTLVAFQQISGAAVINVMSYTFTGNVVTTATPITLSIDSVSYGNYRVELLPTGRFAVITALSGAIVSYLVTLTGAVLSATSALTLLTPVAAADFNSAVSIGVVAPNKVVVCQTSQNQTNFNILTDTAGVQSVGTALSRAFNGALPDGSLRLQVIGSEVWFLTYLAASEANIYRIGASSASPTLLDHQVVATSNASGQVLLPAMTQSTPRGVRKGASSFLQGSSGVIPLLSSNIQTIAFAPFVRRMTWDGDTFAPQMPGASPSEGWMVRDFTGGVGRLTLKKMETTA